MYFQKPFSFEGRISRGEYFLSIIITYAYTILSVFILTYIMLDLFGEEEVNGIILQIVLIPAYWFSVAQGVKRCHDRGNSGWYILVPFYGLVLLFGKGDIGETGWGPDPLVEKEEKGDEETY